jgi:hypothetical protein
VPIVPAPGSNATNTSVGPAALGKAGLSIVVQPDGTQLFIRALAGIAAAAAAVVLVLVCIILYRRLVLFLRRRREDAVTDDDDHFTAVAVKIENPSSPKLSSKKKRNKSKFLQQNLSSSDEEGTIAHRSTNESLSRKRSVHDIEIIEPDNLNDLSVVAHDVDEWPLATKEKAFTTDVTSFRFDDAYDNTAPPLFRGGFTLAMKGALDPSASGVFVDPNASSDAVLAFSNSMSAVGPRVLDEQEVVADHGYALTRLRKLSAVFGQGGKATGAGNAKVESPDALVLNDADRADVDIEWTPKMLDPAQTTLAPLDPAQTTLVPLPPTQQTGPVESAAAEQEPPTVDIDEAAYRALCRRQSAAVMAARMLALATSPESNDDGRRDGPTTPPQEEQPPVGSAAVVPPPSSAQTLPLAAPTADHSSHLRVPRRAAKSSAKSQQQSLTHETSPVKEKKKKRTGAAAPAAGAPPPSPVHDLQLSREHARLPSHPISSSPHTPSPLLGAPETSDIEFAPSAFIHPTTEVVEADEAPSRAQHARPKLAPEVSEMPKRPDTAASRQKASQESSGSTSATVSRAPTDVEFAPELLAPQTFVVVDAEELPSRPQTVRVRIPASHATLPKRAESADGPRSPRRPAPSPQKRGDAAPSTAAEDIEFAPSVFIHPTTEVVEADEAPSRAQHARPKLAPEVSEMPKRPDTAASRQKASQESSGNTSAPAEASRQKQQQRTSLSEVDEAEFTPRPFEAVIYVTEDHDAFALLPPPFSAEGAGQPLLPGPQRPLISSPSASASVPLPARLQPPDHRASLRPADAIFRLDLSSAALAPRVATNNFVATVHEGDEDDDVTFDFEP